MSLEMVPIEIIGLKSDLNRFLSELQALGCVHIDTITESPEVTARPLTMDAGTIRRQEALTLLQARIEGLLEILDCPKQGGSFACAETGASLEGAQERLEKLVPEVQELVNRREDLQAELSTLPLYEATLRKLLPLIPPAAYEPGNVVVGVLVNRANIAALDMIGKQIMEMTLGAAQAAASDVDESTRAMLVVTPQAYSDQVEALLGQKDVSRLRLPPELGHGLPDAVLATIQRRKNAIPSETRAIQQSLDETVAQWCGQLTAWCSAAREELSAYRVLGRFGETDSTFILVGWVPHRDLEKVRSRLESALDETVVVQDLPVMPGMEASAPVLLENSAAARPYESLVRLLELPRYRRIDPSALMSLFLPVFFGLMLGDIGYGAIILAASLLLRRRMKGVFARDLMSVMAVGAGWAILFGVLFGELFGTLGEEIGLHPIWIKRDGAEDVQVLLALAVAIGAVHVTLGLLLGVWEAVRDRSRSHLLERGGMLIGLIGLFLIVGVLAELLPPGLMTPAAAGMIVGIVLLSASLGWIGVLMGPIEFIGLIGNVLSYLRIAAIGLASVYLAKVANEMAGMLGSIVVGVIVAVLIHALNLVMGAFSPAIHSLRLHYVEFFRKFYEGGGREYEPFATTVNRTHP